MKERPSLHIAAKCVSLAPIKLPRVITRAASICGLLYFAALYGCTNSEAARQLQAGRAALLAGKSEVAAQHFERAAALDSKSSGSPLQESAWTYVGRAYYGTKNYPRARQALDRALAQNKDDDIAQLYLGLIGAREQMNESSRKQIHAGLQGVYNRLDYIKRFTVAGEFWDPSGELGTELLALIKTVPASQADLGTVLPRIEQLSLKLENEVDQVQRDEMSRYRGEEAAGSD